MGETLNKAIAFAVEKRQGQYRKGIKNSIYCFAHSVGVIPNSALKALKNTV